MSKPGADPSSGISLGDALRLPKRHPACRRREAQSGSRKKLTCSGHATNARRYRDLGSTCLCRGREWLDLNGIAKVGQADDGPWRQSGVLKEPRVQRVRGLIRTKPMNDLGSEGAPQA